MSCAKESHLGEEKNKSTLQGGQFHLALKHTTYQEKSSEKNSGICLKTGRIFTKYEI